MLMHQLHAIFQGLYRWHTHALEPSSSGSNSIMQASGEVTSNIADRTAKLSEGDVGGRCAQ